MKNELILKEENLIIESKVSHLFDFIRESWKGRGLIERSIILLKVDPSSACQRMFNATISDLREKLILVGIDVVKSVTEIYKLEKVITDNDIKDYKTRGLIDLAHYTGLISYSDKNRLSRAYDIRNDLEHEDSQYEANEADVQYVFQTCIETVLSKDPVHLIKVADVQALIESSDRVLPDTIMIEDFKVALTPRQFEVIKRLIGISLDENKPDIVVENSYNALKTFSPFMQNEVKLSITTFFSNKHRILTYKSARIFYAAGIFPYTDIKTRKRLFEEIYQRLLKTGNNWSDYPKHREALNIFYEIGFLNYCPRNEIFNIIRWLVILYVGQSGASLYRDIYYSNVGAPMAMEILVNSHKTVLPYKDKISKDLQIKKIVDSYSKLQPRIDRLIDAIQRESSSIEN